MSKAEKNVKPSFAQFVKGASSRQRTKIYRSAQRNARDSQVAIIHSAKANRTIEC